MCGIFSVSLTAEAARRVRLRHVVRELFLLSESRGKEAAGFAFVHGETRMYKRSPHPASDLVRSEVFRQAMRMIEDAKDAGLQFIGHSRLVTNGYEHNNENNQPVIRDGFALVHNGIVVNHEKLWNDEEFGKRQTQLDTEVLPALLAATLRRDPSIDEAVTSMFTAVYGMTNIIALLPGDQGVLHATNNGSLYTALSIDGSIHIAASERGILERCVRKLPELGVTPMAVGQLPLRQPQLVQCDRDGLTIRSAGAVVVVGEAKANLFAEMPGAVSSTPVFINTSMEYGGDPVPQEFIEEYERRKEHIDALRRCSRCILPETFPFIDFDDEGVCNYCRNYVPIRVLGRASLQQVVDQYRSTRKDGYDCLVPFSGGRDSSYVLHVLVEELGLRPLAFSYDWGMLTDLARRNQARMCGALGVEHILISADIRKKRDNIRKNVTAWLKRPRLGTVPLFMAGDKQYFYYANKLMQEHGLSLSLMGENLLETTRFKSGFCGIRPHFGAEHTYSLNTSDKARMLLYYAREYALNPSYINTSLFDTLDAFSSYYVAKHRNENLYQYIAWDEEQIVSTLRRNYNWEVDNGTSATWRIGDGTAAFYNCIYLAGAGFTENDTFRSNQIREGVLNREQALVLVENENKPRWDSIQWYCHAISVPWKTAVDRIHQMRCAH